MVAYYANGRLSLPVFLILTLAMWGLFLIPALLERRIRSGERKAKGSTKHQLLTANVNGAVGEVSNAKSSHRN